MTVLPFRTHAVEDEPAVEHIRNALQLAQCAELVLEDHDVGQARQHLVALMSRLWRAVQLLESRE